MRFKILLITICLLIVGGGCSTPTNVDTRSYWQKEYDQREEIKELLSNLIDNELWKLDQRVEKLEVEQVKISSTTKELSDEVFFNYY